MPQFETIYDYNLNLINSSSLKSEEELKKQLIEKGFIENNGKYYLNKDKDIGIDPKNDLDICLENYILNEEKKLNLKKHELLVFEKIPENFTPKIDIDKIKKFLSKFLISNLFKEIYSILYPENLIFPFQNLKSSQDFINENLSFIPMKNKISHGSTDKFTLEIIIYLDQKNYFNIPKNFDENKKEDSILLEELMTGELIKTGIHEINHEMYNIYYYHSNGKISLKTQRKMVNGKDIRESGKEIEILLFGSNITTINLKQVLYLLNEKNFNKGIVEFRNGFNDMKDDDLNIEGEFKHFNDIKKSNYYNALDDFSISTEEFQHSLSISANNYNDAL